MAYTLPLLPYTFSALEPYLDAKTMQIHYEKHHSGYVEKLNKGLALYPQWKDVSLEDLLCNWEQLPYEIQQLVRNQGGGHWNHTFFWQCMDPASSQISLELLSLVEKQFGTFDAFKDAFIREAVGFFGSGWTWLVVDRLGQLRLYSTPNHDHPGRFGFFPLLVVDLWEHAYYLKFQNRRLEFITAWWNVINWSFVSEQYTAYRVKEN